MPSKIIKLRQSEEIPDGAKFLYAREEKDADNFRIVEEYVGTTGLFPFSSNIIQKKRVYKMEMFFYYEVTEAKAASE